MDILICCSPQAFFNINRDARVYTITLTEQSTLREESRQTKVILRYKLLTAILSEVCSVIQQSYYVLHFYYTLYDGKYDCQITMH